MKNSDSTNTPNSPNADAPKDMGFSPWERLKTKRISYLTLPLLVMATIVEFVILATGWRYQQVVCLPQGMGVTFFGIGPIGATILAVELLKLPLAIWTASRYGWQKIVMLWLGLPLICILTFQLVKDMAVYEMGTALKPAAEFLEKASAEDIKISQLNGELTAIEQKKVDREKKLAEVAAKQAKGKAEIEDALKRNDLLRTDAITLTDYQKKELAEAEFRQATIIRQFDADTAQITKALAELRARRETEVARATTWNAEEARIENAYKTKLAAYTNKKAAYDKDKAEYDSAGYLKRKLMREPVHPGVPPEREANKILRPTLVAELEEQIKTKEAELVTVNNKRRERVAQVDADARRLREDFDRRSGTKREETDRKREELLAALEKLVKESAAEAKQIDEDLGTVVQKVDGIRGEIDACRKRAEGFYEARERAIRNTQVHRIATTVEIVRGLLMGERPMSIKATAKERGDILTDQISMVRIWVYPVLAFIVAFLPTLMVEIGFSTVFQPEQQRPAYRLGFMGRRLHWLYKRAGRQKILRAERMASEATALIAARDKALASANASTEKALREKSDEVRRLQEALSVSKAAYEEQFTTKQGEWETKFATLTDSLNKTTMEKDALRDFQQLEIERQVQLRQNIWNDRLAQMRQEMENQHSANEAERMVIVQEHQKKLLEVSEDCRAQVLDARRQLADAELAAKETSARLESEAKEALNAQRLAMVQEHQKKLLEVTEAARAQVAEVRRQLADAELAAEEKSVKVALDAKEALNARDTACSQLQLQVESLTLKLAQAKEETARELEKAARQEKHKLELQQLEFAKTSRQRNDGLDHQLKRREQELSLEFDTRLAQEQAKAEQAARAREERFERELDARAREVDTRWTIELQKREEAAQIRLKQREQQLQAQAEVRLSEVQLETEQEMRRRELEFERQLEAQARDADARLREELQQKDLGFHARMKQREQELTAKAAARETELQNQWISDLRDRQAEWQQQADSLVRATETRLGHEAQQKEEVFAMKLRQREQELQSQFDTRQAELRAQWDQNLRSREQEWERDADARARASESRWKAEAQEKDELNISKSRQRDQQWQARFEALRVEFQTQNEQELRRRDAEAAETRQRALRDLEMDLRKEMQENDEAAQAEAKQREQELLQQMAAQADAHQIAKKEWETELEIMRSNIEPFQALLARTEKERDEARVAAAESARQMQDLEKKLMEASSFLTGWKNGKNSVATRVGRDPFQVVSGGAGPTGEQ